MAITFGERLRELRKLRQITQRALASQTGVDYTYISKIETGDTPPPSAATIHRMAEVLDANEDELMVLAGKIPAETYRALAAQLANTSPYFFHHIREDVVCFFCNTSAGRQHTPRCVWRKAQALVAPQEVSGAPV